MAEAKPLRLVGRLDFGLGAIFLKWGQGWSGFLE